MANALAKPHRRWLRFSLRTMFVVMTAFAVAVGWVAWQRQIVRERWAMRDWLKSQGALIIPDMVWAGISVRGSRARHQHRHKLAAIERRQRPTDGPRPLGRRWWGDEPVEGIWLSNALGDRRAEIERLFPDSTIVLESEAVRDEDIERERRVRQALAEPTRLTFENAPLQDAVDYLKDLLEIEIQFDVAALDKAGIDREVLVTFQAQDVPLRNALETLLNPLKLTFIAGPQMIITTEDGAREYQKTLPGTIRPNQQP